MEVRKKGCGAGVRPLRTPFFGYPFKIREVLILMQEEAFSFFGDFFPNLIQSLAVAQPAGLEHPRRERTEGKTADVGHVSHAAALHLGQRTDFAE